MKLSGKRGEIVATEIKQSKIIIIIELLITVNYSTGIIKY